MKEVVTQDGSLKFRAVVEFLLPRTVGFNRTVAKAWLLEVAQREGAAVERLTYQAFRRPEMIELNQKFLQHDYDTDIISFPESEHPLPISADFALGWDQIKEQSSELNELFIRELHRILVHGLLHCIGYNDTDAASQLVMRSKEDFYLNLHPLCSTWNK